MNKACSLLINLSILKKLAMRHFFLFLVALLSFSVFGQTPIITMISDGDCSGGTPKVVEIYAQGAVDFTLYSLELQSNANTTWGGTESLAGLGIITDAFVYLYRTADQAIFDVEYPSVVNTLGLAASLNFNGDDRIRIIETSTTTVIDQFGEEGIDGTGMPWEYTDGYAKRNAGTGPEVPFVTSNWTYGLAALDLLGLCQGGADPFETLIGIGTYTPPVVSNDPTISVAPNALSGFVQFVGTPSAEQSLEVSGSNLTNDITLTITSGDYEISETSGAGFTNSITLTQNAGVVAPTTIYVRLNGLVAASPSDGEITLTSSGAIDVIVALSGEILNPLPTVFVSEDTLIGFSHFVGTPSAEQTFDISGAFLTDDILITAPGEYEVSLTSGSGFSNSLLLTQTAGEVANTTIYVRLNGLVMNSNQVGDVVISSTGVANELVFVSGETLDYTLSTIAGVSQLDTNNLAESIGFLAELRGIVHCIDFRAGNGYNVTLIDGEGDGIQIFNFNQISNYESTEGDSLIVKGEIGQFNGLLQIIADEITLVSQGNAIVSPQIVTQLDENTENQLVTLENLYFSTPTANWPTNGNVDVTNGVLTFTARVVTSSPYSGGVTPSEPFKITGIGGQYDNSSPYDGGYQIFPCMVEELCNLDNSTTTSDLTITASQVGVNYQWIDCATGNSLAGETNQSFTATQNGSYAVILSDGICTDTSECVVISTIGIKELESNFEIYPIPFENQLFLQGNNVKFQIEIYNLEGRLITSLSDINEKLTIDTKTWSKGVYTVIISSGNQMEYRKLIK